MGYGVAMTGFRSRGARRGALRKWVTKKASGYKRRRVSIKRWTRHPGAKRQRFDQNRSKTQPFFSQWCRDALSYGKGKRGYAYIKLQSSMTRDPLCLKLKLTKNFSDRGYYPANKQSTSTGTLLPVFAVALNGMESIQNASVFPIRQLFVGDGTGSVPDGALAWSGIQNVDQSNTAINGYYVDKAPKPNTVDKAIYKGSRIQFNFWGAKNKPVKISVMLCSVSKYEDQTPFTLSTVAGTSGLTPVSRQHQQMFEEVIKQYTYNPISQIDWHNVKGLKVYRTWEHIIEPGQTTENDVSPSVCTLKWNVKAGQLCHFDGVTAGTFGDIRQVDDNNFFNNIETQAAVRAGTWVPRNVEQRFLIVRISDYGSRGNFTIDNHGSFDMDVRSWYDIGSSSL